MSPSPTPFDPGLPLADVPGAVERELRAFFERRLAEVDAIGAPVVTAALHLSDFVLSGGKRIRPLYGWAGFVGGGGLERSAEDPKRVLRAVSALELIQACALIHDDIIDSSDTRRGRPTVHRAVEAEHRARDMGGNAAEFGRNVAILAGDLALVWADDMWRESGVSPDALARAQDPWRGMRTEVLGGQLLDITLEATGDESIELANKVNRFKTAAYTIERPLHLGAAVAGAPAATIEAFRGYGRDIGIAFQLRDDLLGVFGDSAVTGKPAGDDLREGKRTVLLSLALEALDRSDPAAAAELRAGVGSATDPSEIDRLSSIIRVSGAVEGVEKQIAELTTSGLAHLEKAGVTGPVAETLRELAIRSTARRA
ncbi:polyprenyl synthetase family protein [Corynebacterium auris]|uniref:polyprenyl synthetase family protein n=1 Tax=Corynebacterium auris TaxID=44750 RepID=UPI0025B326FB|nr:polyprenyl synthetase family protein [Corynebacterium auris]WJY68412.1 (2E,6E)-farnesyl diphosphate synthase [Corynebacterium auris]